MAIHCVSSRRNGTLVEGLINPNLQKVQMMVELLFHQGVQRTQKFQANRAVQPVETNWANVQPGNQVARYSVIMRRAISPSVPKSLATFLYWKIPIDISEGEASSFASVSHVSELERPIQGCSECIPSEDEKPEGNENGQKCL